MNKQAEYITLNNQILAYEKYAFERTLLIGFIGFPCLGIMDDGFYYWIPFLVMLSLIFNMSYTYKNLEKAIDIKVYLHNVLEGHKDYIGWPKFLMLREKYIIDNKKIVSQIDKQYENDSDITIEKNQINQIRAITAIFLILYLTVTIIFMNSDSSTYGHNKLLPIVLAGGLLAIFTFIIGIIQVFVAGNVNIVAEKKITENILKKLNQKP